MLQRLTQLKNRKGFTLIEMIVVLIIIAILIVATVPTMMGFIREARTRADAAIARTAYVAAQQTIIELMNKNTAPLVPTLGQDVTTLVMGEALFGRLLGSDHGSGTITSITIRNDVDGSVTLVYTPAAAGPDNIITIP